MQECIAQLPSCPQQQLLLCVHAMTVWVRRSRWDSITCAAVIVLSRAALQSPICLQLSSSCVGSLYSGAVQVIMQQFNRSWVNMGACGKRSDGFRGPLHNDLQRPQQPRLLA
jgi:hypothetical protein